MEPDLAAQIEELRRALHRQRQGQAAALAAACVVLMLWSACCPGFLRHRALTAERFVLIDHARHRRGGLGFTPGGEPMLYLEDRRGQRRVELAVRADGRPVLHLMDGEGHQRWQVYLDADGAPYACWVDAAGQVVMDGGQYASGARGLTVYARAAGRSLSLGFAADGRPLPAGGAR